MQSELAHDGYRHSSSVTVWRRAVRQIGALKAKQMFGLPEIGPLLKLVGKFCYKLLMYRWKKP